MPVYAMCPKHGGFPVPGLRISDSTNVTFSGARASCPACGGYADIMQGTYNFIGEVAQMLTGPSWSRDLLQQMQRDVIATTSEVESAVTNADVMAAIDRLSQKYDALSLTLEPQAAGKPKKTVVHLLKQLLAILGVLTTLHAGAQLTAEVYETIQHHVAQIDSEPDDKPGPPPSP